MTEELIEKLKYIRLRGLLEDWDYYLKKLVIRILAY